MQRVMPASSSSSPFSSVPSSATASRVPSLSSLGISTTSDSFSFSLPLRLERTEPPLLVTPFLCSSSRGSSRSSFLARLFLPAPLLCEGLSDGRTAGSLFLGGPGLASDGGEPTGDLLEEGAGRRPERRGSFGEGGGPMVATLAIADVGRYDGEVRKGEGMVEGRDTDNGPHFPVLCLESRFWLISPAFGINDGTPRQAAIPGLLLVTVSDPGQSSPHPQPWPCPLGHSSTVLFMNGSHTAATASHDEAFHFSDNDGDDEAPDPGLGDYSARFDELMSDSEDHEGGDAEDDGDDDDEEAFVYSGVDADPTGGYREQLRDVLGPDHEEDELEEEQEVERSLVHEVAENEKFAATIEDEAGVSCSAYMPRRFRLLMLMVVVACPGAALSLAAAHVSSNACALIHTVEYAASSWKWVAASAAFRAPVLTPLDISSAILHTSALARGFRSERCHTSFPLARVDFCCAFSLLRTVSIVIGHELVSAACAPGWARRRNASNRRSFALDPVTRHRGAYICGAGIQGIRIPRRAFLWFAHRTRCQWAYLHRDRHWPGACV